MPEPLPEFPLDVPVPATFTAALAGLVDRGFLGSRRWQEQQWRADRLGANPLLLEFEKRMVGRAAKLGIPLFASEVIRSRVRQDHLYALGNSKAKAGQSPHQYGLAVDIVHSVRGWALSRMEWELLGHIGSEAAKGLGVVSKIEWGGEWSFYDPAHWQIGKWREWQDQFPFDKHWSKPK